MVKQSHAFKLLVDVTFKVEVSGGEAQPGNLAALDVLIQSVIISKMMNLSSESFRMENHVQMQTDPCSATTTRASVGLLSVSSAQSPACYCRCWPKLVTGGKPQPNLQLAHRRHFQGGSKWW